jgi:hypothetical protein
MGLVFLSVKSPARCAIAVSWLVGNCIGLLKDYYSKSDLNKPLPLESVLRDYAQFSKPMFITLRVTIPIRGNIYWI